MPRYFFHVMDGHVTIDHEGTELDGIADVRREAVRFAGGLLTSEMTNLNHGWPWRLTVADAAGDVVYSLDFTANHHGY